VWTVLAASASPVQPPADQSGLPPRQVRGRALEGMVQAKGDASLQQFAQTHMAPKYRDSFASPDKLIEYLRAIREACAGFGGVMADPLPDGMRMLFMKEGYEVAVTMHIDAEAPHQIVGLELDTSGTSAAQGVQVEPITWDNAAQRLNEEAAHGFAGTVLLVKDGRIALHEGYGLANRERNIPNGKETIFAIGSVPIDFTRGAILKLEEMGKLRTSDPITKYVQNVPADKQTMTIDQLLSGKSGLPDFHHIAGVDKDFDLTWIDRDTAIKRILGATLLFPPGQGEAHSHSAWVLLAAIVELVSKQSYSAFLHERFFAPAGMTRTGNHEDGERFADDQFAVGYEGQSVGSPNIPKHWGKTSWLVMGSGGMQSTPMDLYRWNQAIRTGKTLGANAAKKYFQNAILAGGDDRGFFTVYNEGPGDMFFLCSNAHSGPGDRTSKVGRRLAEMVRGR
jgi:CubicO group peptidase (beta-lactamase class C family)